MTSVIGLDFGGTSIKGGHAHADGTVVAEDSIPIEIEAGAESVIERVADLARRLGATSSSLLGVGCAGLIDRASGTLIDSPNLKPLVGKQLAREIAARLGGNPEQAVFENDANVAALGESWLGAGQSARDMMLVTLGTGVGGGIVLGGELFVGPTGNAGEIGHVVVEPDGLVCGCSKRGCLETVGSATAARRRALELGLPPEAPGDLIQLAAAARAADGPERKLLHAVGRDLGHGLAYPAVLLDLSLFVFGGGFSAALDVLQDGIVQGLDERLFGERNIVLRQATLGGSAGWIGAAKLALDRCGSGAPR